MSGRDPRAARRGRARGGQSQQGQALRERDQRRQLRRDVADEAGVAPEDVETETADGRIEATLSEAAQRDQALEEIVNSSNLSRGEIARLEETESGFRPVLTDEARRGRALQQIVSSSDLSRNEIAELKETESGFQPVLTDAARRARRQEQIRDNVIRELVTERGFERGDIKSLSVRDGDVDVTLTDEARRERAAEQLDAQTDFDVDEGNISLTEDGAQLNRQTQRRQAFRNLDEETATDLDPLDLTLGDEGVTLTDAARRREAAAQIDADTDFEVSPGDVALSQDGAQVRQSVVQERAAATLAAETGTELTASDIERSEDQLRLTESAQRRVARERFEEQPAAGELTFGGEAVGPDAIADVRRDDGAFEPVIAPGVRRDVLEEEAAENLQRQAIDQNVSNIFDPETPAATGETVNVTSDDVSIVGSASGERSVRVDEATRAALAEQAIEQETGATLDSDDLQFEEVPVLQGRALDVARGEGGVALEERAVPTASGREAIIEARAARDELEVGGETPDPEDLQFNDEGGLTGISGDESETPIVSGAVDVTQGAADAVGSTGAGGVTVADVLSGSADATGDILAGVESETLGRTQADDAAVDAAAGATVGAAETVSPVTDPVGDRARGVAQFSGDVAGDINRGVRENQGIVSDVLQFGTPGAAVAAGEDPTEVDTESRTIADRFAAGGATSLVSGSVGLPQTAARSVDTGVEAAQFTVNAVGDEGVVRGTSAGAQAAGSTGIDAVVGIGEQVERSPAQSTGALFGGTVTGSAGAIAASRATIRLRGRLNTRNASETVPFEEIERPDVRSGQSRLTRFSEDAVPGGRRSMDPEDFPVQSERLAPDQELRNLADEFDDRRIREALDAEPDERTLFSARSGRKRGSFTPRSGRPFDPDAAFLAGSVSRNFLDVPDSPPAGSLSGGVRRPRPIAAGRSLVSAARGNETPTIVATAGRIEELPSNVRSRGEITDFLAEQSNTGRFFTRQPGNQSGEAEALVAARGTDKENPDPGAGRTTTEEATTFVEVAEPIATEVRGERVPIQFARQDTGDIDPLSRRRSFQETVSDFVSDERGQFGASPRQSQQTESATVGSSSLGSSGSFTPGGEPGAPLLPFAQTGPERDASTQLENSASSSVRSSVRQSATAVTTSSTPAPITTVDSATSVPDSTQRSSTVSATATSPTTTGEASRADSGVQSSTTQSPTPPLSPLGSVGVSSTGGVSAVGVGATASPASAGQTAQGSAGQSPAAQAAAASGPNSLPLRPGIDTDDERDRGRLPGDIPRQEAEAGPPDPLAPGWLTETVSDIATIGNRQDPVTRSELEQARETPTALTGELPTAEVLDDEASEDVAAVQGLFGLGPPLEESSGDADVFDFGGEDGGLLDFGGDDNGGGLL